MSAIEVIDPAEAGLNAERLKRIPEYFDCYIEKQKLPCAKIHAKCKHYLNASWKHKKPSANV